jgi:tetratricopeptide (TPR) repeat protein
MSITLQQNITQARSLLDSNDFKGAFKILERIDVDVIESEEDRSEYYYLLGLYYYYTEQYPQALETILPALELSRKTNNHSLYASEQQLHGWILRERGEIIDAIEAFNGASISARRAGDYRKVYTTLNDHASAHFLRGNLEVALDGLDNALRFAREHNLSVDMGICERNKARVLIFQGNFCEADKILQSYYNNGEITPLAKANVRLLLGMLNVFIMDERKATRHLTEARKAYEELSMPRDQNISLEYTGILEYFLGNYDNAKRIFKDILDRNEITASARAQTLRLLTEIYAAEGDFGNAEKKVREAEEAIKKVNEQIELGALYRVYGQIHAHKNEKDRAREYFQESITILKRTGARYERALTYLICGTSVAYNSRDRGNHLRKAKELFDDMMVAKRIEKAAVEIEALQVQTGSVGMPVLAACVLGCVLSVIFLEGKLLGFGVFFGCGILAYEAIMMMSAAKNKEEKKVKN